MLPPDVVAAFLHAVTFDEQIGDYAKRLGPGASVRDAALTYLDDNGLQGDARRRAQFAIRLFSEQEENMYWNRISLDYLADYSSPYDGVGQGNFPAGGYHGLVAAMAGKTDVRLGHEVKTISASRDGVDVITKVRGTGKAKRFKASHVIVTVPLGVLKHGGVEFAKPLPAAKRKAIRRLGFGYFEKVALVFDEPFWQAGAHTHIVRLADPFGFPLTLDLKRLSGFNALNALYAGRPAQRLRNATAAEKTQARPRGDPRGDGRRPDPGAGRLARHRLAPGPLRARLLLHGHPRPPEGGLRRPRKAGRADPVRGRGQQQRPQRLFGRRHEHRHPRGQAPASGVVGVALGRLS